MNFSYDDFSLIWALSGLLLGVLFMRFLMGKDTSQLQQLTTELAVAEEKIKQFQAREAEFKILQQQFFNAKTENAQLQTRMEEQLKNTEEKLKLLLDAELRLNTQFENLAGKIFDDRSKQFTEHHKTSLDHIVTPLREQLGEFKQRIETVYDNENKDRISLREEIV
ncbi:MAG: DNA recombination protein RmuC, partial [Methylobacter sp.]|nr:DNA recombination protein RmuC [Methylobacter sp.]